MSDCKFIIKNLNNLSLEGIPDDTVTGLIRRHHPSTHYADTREQHLLSLRQKTCTEVREAATKQGNQSKTYISALELQQLLKNSCFRQGIEHCRSFFHSNYDGLESTKLKWWYSKHRLHHKKDIITATDTVVASTTGVLNDISQDELPSLLEVNTNKESNPKSATQTQTQTHLDLPHQMNNSNNNNNRHPSSSSSFTVDVFYHLYGLVLSLTKLKFYTQAVRALDLLGPLPNLVHKHSKTTNTNLSGDKSKHTPSDEYDGGVPLFEISNVPFSLYILKDLLYFIKGNHDDAIGNFYSLVQDCQFLENYFTLYNLTIQSRYWLDKKQETKLVIAWCLYKMNEFTLSIEVCQKILAFNNVSVYASVHEKKRLYDEDNGGGCSISSSSSSSGSCNNGLVLEVLGMIGRLYLCIGDTNSAKLYFDEIKLVCNVTSHKDLNNGLNGNRTIPKRTLSNIYINEGILSIAIDNNVEQAEEHLVNAVKVDPSNLSAKANVIVAFLYSSELDKGLAAAKEFLKIMKKTQNTSLHLHATYLDDTDSVNADNTDSVVENNNLNTLLFSEVVLNASFMYELQSSKSVDKKRQLLDYMVHFPSDSFPGEVFKL